MLLFVAAPSLAQDRLILAFGDSLTAGYGLAPAQGFAPRLQAALRKSGVPATVHNGGVSGDTTAGGRARLGWVLASLKRKPDLVILELGANDMLRGYPPARARANLDAMLGQLRGSRVPVLLAGMKATRNMGPGYVAQFEGMYPALAAKYRVPLYPFFLDGVAGRRDLVLPDGLHPNPRGVDRIVAGITPAVRRALSRR
jgi:acyl-CoA thioesterase-1